MSNMRVRLLLDMVNRLSPQAKAARNDLRGVGAEAKALNRARGADALNASLKMTAGQASAAQAAIAKARAEAKALGATNARPKGLDQIKRDLAGFQNRRAAFGAGGRAAGRAAAESGALTAGQGAAVGAAAGAARGAIARAAPALIPAVVVAESVRNFKNLETAERELAVTTDATDAQVREATDGFRKQSGQLGATALDMIKAAQLFAASGQTFRSATEAVTPTVKTAKAAFADTNDVATAGIAVMQNLKVPVSQLQEAYDRMALSAKEGQVEMKDLAKELPGALASYEKIGRTGLSGLSDVSAQMQIVRRSTSSAAEATNRLTNLYEKITAEETVKNFKEQQVDLQKEIEKGAKKGETALETVLRLTDKIVRKKDGTIDAFKLNSLFPDLQARGGAQALLNAMRELAELRDKISKQGAGTVDRDFKRASDRIQAEFDRLSAAWSTTLGRMGQAVAPFAAGAAGQLAKAVEAIDAKLREATDETRSGPLERAAARQGGEDAARREFESARPQEEERQAGDETKALADAFQRKVIDRLFSFGEAGQRDGDLQRNEAAAYQLEREKRLNAMRDAARARLAEARAARAVAEKPPSIRDVRTPGGMARRAAAIDGAKDDELNANEDVRRAEQLRAGKEKSDAELRQLAADMKGLTSVLATARKMQPGAASGREFRTAAGKGATATAADAIGGAGAGPGIVGFGAPIGGAGAAGAGKTWAERMQVEMQPAGALIVQQIADGIKAGQGQTDGAAQQIGDGVKGKLSAVEAGSAGQKIMADFAAGIVAGGAAAVAAAEGVAARVKAAMGGAGGGLRSASLSSVSSAALHDGVA